MQYINAGIIWLYRDLLRDCMSNQEVVDFIKVRIPQRESGKQQSKMAPEKVFVEEVSLVNNSYHLSSTSSSLLF